MGLSPAMILKGIDLLSGMKDTFLEQEEDKGVIDSVIDKLKIEQIKSETGVCETCGARSMICPHCGEKLYY